MKNITWNFRLEIPSINETDRSNIGPYSFRYDKLNRHSRYLTYQKSYLQKGVALSLPVKVQKRGLFSSFTGGANSELSPIIATGAILGAANGIMGSVGNSSAKDINDPMKLIPSAALGAAVGVASALPADPNSPSGMALSLLPGAVSSMTDVASSFVPSDPNTSGIINSIANTANSLTPLIPGQNPPLNNQPQNRPTDLSQAGSIIGQNLGAMIGQALGGLASLRSYDK